MECPPETIQEIAGRSRKILRRLLTIGANRLELLRVEVQEERLLLLHAIFLGFGISALCLLAGISLTAMVAVLFYKSSPATALMVIAGLDLSAAWFLYRRLHRLLSEWRDLPSSLEQLRKDRSCLQDIIN